jgi:ABC-type multidrug transport system ATPase subunit
MDVESVAQMIQLLAGFRKRIVGTNGHSPTILLTTHQRELAAPIADWILTLRAGRVQSLEVGTPTL